MTQRMAHVENRTVYPDTPAGRLMRSAGLKWHEVATFAGCDHMRVRHLVRHGVQSHCNLDTLLKVAAALGAAPAELWPELAVRPRRGLLWDRGVFVSKASA